MKAFIISVMSEIYRPDVQRGLRIGMATIHLRMYHPETNLADDPDQLTRWLRDQRVHRREHHESWNRLAGSTLHTHEHLFEVMRPPFRYLLSHHESAHTELLAEAAALGISSDLQEGILHVLIHSPEGSAPFSRAAGDNGRLHVHNRHIELPFRAEPMPLRIAQSFVRIP
jgi:hypothetical protein